MSPDAPPSVVTDAADELPLRAEPVRGGRERHRRNRAGTEGETISHEFYRV